MVTKRKIIYITPQNYPNLYGYIPEHWKEHTFHIPKYFNPAPANLKYLKPFSHKGIQIKFFTRWLNKRDLWEQFVKAGLAGQYVYVPKEKSKRGIPYWTVK